MEKIDRILKELQMTTPDLEGSALMGSDGSVLTAVLPEGLGGDKIRELTSALFLLGEDTAKQLERGIIDKIFVKGEEGYIVFTSIGGMGVLTVLANKNARIGLIFADVERASEEIERILREKNPDTRNILIIDDEKPFLLSLSAGLRHYDDTFNMLQALNGKEAVEILNSTRVDVVVTDLKMPVMDGFELLAYMSRNYQDIPVIVMTAYGTPEIEEQLEDFTITQYLEKPLDFSTLADNIFDVLEANAAQDYIRGVSLVGFLPLIAMEKKTCTVTIKSRGRDGSLYFRRGELIGAETGGLQGEAAALDIATWDKVKIKVKYICKVKKRDINLQLPEILIEGLRRKDEGNSMDGTPTTNSGTPLA